MTVYYIWPQISGINYGDIFVISSVKVTRMFKKKIIVKNFTIDLYNIFTNQHDERSSIYAHRSQTIKTDLKIKYRNESIKFFCRFIATESKQ